MNNLDVTLLGGFPLDLDDLEWQFNAYRRAFADICDGFGRAVIMHGCERAEVAANTYDVAAGAVIMDGELYPFDGVAEMEIPDITQAWFVPELTVDPSGSEVFEDLETRNAYLVRRAVLVLSGSPPIGAKCRLDGARLGQAIAALTFDVPLLWNDAIMVNDWAISPPPYLRPQYRIEPGRMVRIRGAVNGSAHTSATAFVLPAGFRPQGVIRTTVHSLADPSVVRMVQIDTSGNVQIIIISAPGANDVFDLTSLPPFEAAAI